MTTRVIMHTPEPSSGAAFYVANLVKALLAAGERVVLLCPRNFAYDSDLSRSGAAVVYSGARSTESANLLSRIVRNFAFLLRLCIRQVLTTRSRDIVHFQFPLYFPAGLIFFLLARVQARGVVFTAHDPLPHKWLLPARLRFAEQRSLRCAYDLSDRIIVHNNAAKELLVRAFNQAPSKIAVIPHGSSTPVAADLAFPESDKLELLLFGSIRENKGLELAIEAVQNINSQGLQVRLLIAGTPANARERVYWNSCKNRIAEASAGISVVERFVADDEAAALLTGCQAVLLPYRDFESESGVAALALASGRAILATDSGSLATLLNACDLGIPIQSPTAASVERAIRVAISLGAEALREKGLRAHSFARCSRSWDGIGKQTARLYRELEKRPISTVREPTHG